MSGRSAVVHLSDTCGLAELEQLLAGGGKQMHKARDDSGPSGLMACTKASSIVAVEVLVEENEVPPMRILLKLSRTTVYWRRPYFLQPFVNAPDHRALK